MNCEPHLRGKLVCYSFGGFNSEGMKSDNPHAGCYVTDVARTIDYTGGNPACNQEGILVLERKVSPAVSALGIDLYNQAITGGGINDCDIKTF